MIQQPFECRIANMLRMGGVAARDLESFAGRKKVVIKTLGTMIDTLEGNRECFTSGESVS